MRGERLADDLVHIVVTIASEPAQEKHVGTASRERFVAFVEERVLRPRNRIVRVAVTTRELETDRGRAMRLPREMLELGDARVRHVRGWIVDDPDRLVAALGQGAMLEGEAAIRKGAEAAPEIGVDRAGVDRQGRALVRP